MSIPHFSWLWLLVAYLWLTGGTGWVKGTEFSSQRALSKSGRVIAHIGWPIFSGISILGEWYTAIFGPRGK